VTPTPDRPPRGRTRGEHRSSPRSKRSPSPAPSPRASTARAEPAPSPPAGAPASPSANVWLLRSIRYVLPGAIVLGGAIVMAMGGEDNLEGGMGIVSAGLAVYFVNWLFRIGAAGERERDAEDAARAYFERHGRWPD
jgi:hypothetical protein